jgi:hypothetical protein
MRFKIVSAHLLDGLGDLLSVGPDVLHGSAACIAGNAGETLDSGVVVIDRIAHHVVPVLSRAYLEDDAPAFFVFVPRDRYRNTHHESVKTLIAHQEIASATKDEQWQLSLMGELDGFEKFRLCFDLAEEAGRTTDAEGRERR